MKMQMNYIAGRWIDGIDVIINVSSSDLSDTVGEYAIASTAQVEEAIAAARASSRAWA